MKPSERIQVSDGSVVDPGFTQKVIQLTGEEVVSCFQCLKCTNGCPLAPEMDVPPNKAIRYVQLGMRDAALAADSIWICATCYTCSVRCPNDIDIAHVMDTLRRLAYQTQGDATPKAHIVHFHELFLDSLKQYGRVNETKLLARYELKEGRFLKDAKLGMKMFFMGKMSVFPQKVQNKEQIKKIFDRASKRKG